MNMAGELPGEINMRGFLISSIVTGALFVASGAGATCFLGIGNCGNSDNNTQNGSIHHNILQGGGGGSVIGSGNSSAVGIGGNATAFGGKGGSVFGSGNSTVKVDNTVNNKNKNTNINKNANVNANRNVNRNANVNNVHQSQGQTQRQDQAQSQSSENTLDQRQSANNEGINVTVAGDHVEAPDMGRLPGTPGDVFLGACGARGVSGSMPGAGVTLGATHPACLHLDMAIVAYKYKVMSPDGKTPMGDIYLKEAHGLLLRDRWYQRIFSWLPLVGPLL